MAKVFITGSSIACALGDDKQSSIKKFKSIDETNYKEYLSSNFKDINYYKIKREFSSQKEKIFTLLLDVINSALKEANLLFCDELRIYLASTSMNISLLEEAMLDENRVGSFGYGDILEFIELNVASKYPVTIMQTACTSAANAIIKASLDIKNGNIKRAIIVGFEFFNNSTYKGFESLMLLSPSGEYKPFDKNSDGLILGEACSAVVLESEKKGEDNFEILGYATSFDDYSITSSNPNADATIESLLNSLKSAKLKLSDIDILKAHATGSENSNFSEATAIDRLFKQEDSICDVVILKPYIGHTLGACATTEIVLLCEAIKDGFVPKTINFKEPYEKIIFKPLLKDKRVKKATTLFHFVGFGGSNASIIISNRVF